MVGARHLRVLRDVVYLVLDELAVSPGEGRELEVLDVSWLPLGDPDGDYGRVATRAWQATLTGKAFPKLRELHLGREAASELDALKDLWTSPLGRQLSLVRLDASYSRAAKALAVAASQATKRLTVELDFGPLLFSVRTGGELTITATDGRGETANLWKDLVAGLDPATWKKLDVTKARLTNAQLDALRKRVPKTSLTT